MAVRSSYDIQTAVVRIMMSFPYDTLAGPRHGSEGILQLVTMGKGDDSAPRIYCSIGVGWRAGVLKTALGRRSSIFVLDVHIDLVCHT